MTNLKVETLGALEEAGKSPKDIAFIMGNGKLIPIEKFWLIADRDYDESYGTAEVNGSLYIVGDDWWLERAEYDGSEWWEFKTQPKKPEVTTDKPFLAIFDGWALKIHGKTIEEEET